MPPIPSGDVWRFQLQMPKNSNKAFGKLYLTRYLKFEELIS